MDGRIQEPTIKYLKETYGMGMFFLRLNITHHYLEPILTESKRHRGFAGIALARRLQIVRIGSRTNLDAGGRVLDGHRKTRSIGGLMPTQ